jgi:hypothetical protein
MLEFSLTILTVIVLVPRNEWVLGRGALGEGQLRRRLSVMTALKNDVHVHHF